MKHRISQVFLSVLSVWFFAFNAEAETVEYDLVIENMPVNLSGKTEVDFALTVNGRIPAPTLEFVEGDEAVITVHNKLKDEEVSIHWHGILLPPEMDGVPYVNTPPIHPGEKFTFRFNLRQHGTYWYHSHTSVQEQKGVYGAFIVHPKKKKFVYDKEAVVVLSDWSDENADEIMKNLKKDGDFYLYKKGSVRSYWSALQADSLMNHLRNEWTRMGGMDLSDVGYDAFLINGKKDSQILGARAGERIRIRIINAAASTYFYVSLGGLPVKVISADGVDIKPVLADELLMGMAETYDVLFTVPESKNYELRATSQDVTGFASGWIGGGSRVHATEKPLPNLYAGMEHDEHSGHGSMAEESPIDHGHAGHVGHASKISTLTVDELRAETSTAFPREKRVYDLKLVLGGDMERYVWHINGKAIHEDRVLEIEEGDVVRFTFQNETMMHHPMHFHGHFFRVLNRHGKHSPLKHTVDVPPHGIRTIEFLANEPGQWMLHCHNLYHMKTGMARVVKYSSYQPTGKMAEYDLQDPHLHDHLYVSGRLEAATNHAQADLRLSRTWDEVEARFETREYDELDHAEGDLLYRRWFGRYLSLLAGGSYFGEYESDEIRAVVGAGYILPFLIESELYVDHRGKFRLDLEKKFQWTRYIHSDVEVSFREQAKTEFEVTLMYQNNWHWSAGVMFTEEDVGIGAQYRF